jgi:outer membrane protein TolC
MLIPVSRKFFAFSLTGALIISATLGICVGDGSEPNQVIIPVAAPVTPVIPAPQQPAGHHIRFQDLIPGHVGKTVEPENGAKQEANGETGPEFSLGDCIAVALERNPSLKAVTASIAGIETGYKSLANIHTGGTLISPDLEIRKQQAQRGMAASAGEYQRVHNEVIQDVTRMYYTAVYAKQQGELADDMVGRLEVLSKLIEDILNKKLPPGDIGGLNMGKLRVVQIGVITAKQLQLKATIGRKQAMAALRQVMNVDEKSFPFRLKDEELPVMAQQVPINKDLVVELALCRRPELALAAAGVDVFRLEVYAQGKIPFRRVVPTFASGTDLHAREIPQAIRSKEYRPGAIIPEMPTQLVGSKYDRVARAMSYSQKAEAVYESAHSLVKLEAENGYYEFEMANEKLKLAKEQFDLAMKLKKLTDERAPDVKEKDQIVQAYIAIAKVQADYVEAIFDQLLSLAALERITAGGIRPAFPGR